MNMQDFYTGHAFDAYEFFGAHTYFGGTHFALWAPSAQHIAVETEAPLTCTAPSPVCGSAMPPASTRV